MCCIQLSSIFQQIDTRINYCRTQHEHITFNYFHIFKFLLVSTRQCCIFGVRHDTNTYYIQLLPFFYIITGVHLSVLYPMSDMTHVTCNYLYLSNYYHYQCRPVSLVRTAQTHTTFNYSYFPSHYMCPTCQCQCRVSVSSKTKLTN